MQETAQNFDLETLIISDVLNTNSRPKIHEYDNCIYISVKMLQKNEANFEISSENFVLIIKKNILLSFQEKEGDVFAPIRERIRRNKKRIRSSGTDYLAFALVDIVIDNYIYLISLIGEKIEILDDELIDNTAKEKLEEINKYKRKINYLRMIIKPCREMIITLKKMDSDLLSEKLDVHLKELQNNIDLANESVDSYREILANILNVYQTNVSNKLNDILKVLTIFSVLFIPLTFIAGIYGTNFHNIPLIQLNTGYFIMWGIIILITISMIIYFKWKKWF